MPSSASHPDPRRASLPPTVATVPPGGPVSSFDPPLSRVTAALIAIGASLVVAWVLYAAHHAPAAKHTVSTVGSVVAP